MNGHQARDLGRSVHRSGRWPPGSLLGGLAERTRTELLSLGTLLQYETGRVLLREGETSTHVILLIDACVKVVATTEEGGDALLDIRMGGDLVGELASLDGLPRSAAVITVGPAIVRIISQSEFAAFLHHNPDAAAAVSRAIAAKLRWATRRRIDFRAREVKVRLARVLDELVESYGEPEAGGAMVTPPLTQPELAGLAGAAERTVNKALAELRRDGVIQTGYRSVTVLDRGRLRSIASLHDQNP